MYIDSHCHLHDREFFTDAEATEMLGRAHDANVAKIICIGTSHADSMSARDFAAQHDNVYWTYGIHPEHAGKSASPGNSPAGVLPDFSLPRLLPDGSSAGSLPSPSPSSRSDTVTRAYCPIAIGEVGLDYHYDGYNREAQIRLFEQMLQLAVDHDLPLSFHVREAFSDFFPVVANFPTACGVVHSFTDSKKTLKRILTDTEFYVGVNGLATYSTLPLPPLDRILLETDAPFLAPVPHRGQTNQPAFIPDIANWLAGKLSITPEQVASATTHNTEKLFHLSP